MGRQLEATHKYDDIINMEHPTSKTRPRMDALNRAAQFAPFAALVGLDEALDNTGREHEALNQDTQEHIPFED